jgi:three-Cys-motif partner protein
MPEATVWELEHHTAAKHEILRRYLAAWFPILTIGSYNKRVLFLDGFAGPAIYSHGEPGSPIIALDTLVSHKVFDRLDHTEFVFFFIEKDEERFESLERELAAFWTAHGGRPDNVRVHAMNEEFAATASSLLGYLDEQKTTLAPTFAFIDPFGWSRVDLDVICRLLAFDKCEVFFNFMYDSVNRFVNHPNPTVQGHLSDLFGTDRYTAAAGLDPASRKLLLHDLYKDQLQEHGGFRYVHSFEMVNRQGHTVYSLFYGTQNIAGLRVMKDAMWAADPVGGVRFSDQLAGQPVLFGDEPDFGPLRTAIVEKFSGRTVTIDEVEEFVLVETPCKAAGYKTKVLRPLETDGLFEVPTPRKRPLTYPNGGPRGRTPWVITAPSSGLRPPGTSRRVATEPRQGAITATRFASPEG